MHTHNGLFSDHNSLCTTLICKHIKAWVIAMHAIDAMFAFFKSRAGIMEIFRKINQSLAPHHQSYFPYSSQEHFIESEHVGSAAGATIYI